MYIKLNTKNMTGLTFWSAKTQRIMVESSEDPKEMEEYTINHDK